ncbi:MAG: hypothetical protein J7647_16310 [Cyanobacteria bacterium SBLK]|nr:hypothetical protein [Cyanobacteria bacterium SBLK]
MSNAIVILSFDDLQNASNENFFFFREIGIDVNGVMYSLPTYLFLTSFTLSTAKKDYATISDSFSATLKPLGISMDNKGVISIDLSAFVNYVQAASRSVADEIDVYALFKDYVDRDGFFLKREAVTIPLNV